MNKFESERRFAERMKRCYPPGTRLLLLSMDAVFVGFDKNDVPRHANKRGIGRGSTFKGNAESSMDEFAFHRIGKGKSL